jgi:hypothetical protein
VGDAGHLRIHGGGDPGGSVPAGFGGLHLQGRHQNLPRRSQVLDSGDWTGEGDLGPTGFQREDDRDAAECINR